MQDIDSKDLKNHLERPIALVGMMGAGKSHIGAMLAQALDIDIHDVDAVIESKAGMSIPEIFESFGEEKFRASEHSTIMDLLAAEPAVIATGGGALMNPETLQALKDQSDMIWIDAPLDLIWERVKDCTHRPLLQDDNPRAKLEALYEARKPLYAQAHMHIINKNAAQSVSDIIKLLSEKLNQDSV